MRTLTVPSGQDGRKLVRILCDAYPGLTGSRVFRALSRRDIRVNGKRVNKDLPLNTGDEVAVYLPEEAFEQASAPTETVAPLRIAFQNGGILVIDKPAGMPVHSGARIPQGSTLMEQVQQLFPNAGYRLCHRIDRNTGGLILLADGADRARLVQDLMQDDQIVKTYRCLVQGAWTPPERTPDSNGFHELRAWMEKPTGKRVFLHPARSDEAPLSVVTRVRRIQVLPGPDGSDVTELEVRLGTGRTHQIRAHLAHLGHPVVGDGRYGQNQYNRKFRTPDGHRITRQQLFATRLDFFLKDKKHRLAFLAGRCVETEPAYEVDPNELSSLRPE